MIARWVRTWDSKLLRPALLFVARSGLGPNAVTMVSLAFIVGAGLLLAFGYQSAGAALVLLGGFLDGIDGEYARVTGRETRFGAFLDSIADHYGDLAITLGLVWWYVHRGGTAEIVLALLALFGSMLGSQVRSRAGMLSLDVKDVGWITRFERNLILVAGLWARQVILALAVLAVLNNFSAVQRLAHVVRQEQGVRETPSALD